MTYSNFNGLSSKSTKCIEIWLSYLSKFIFFTGNYIFNLFDLIVSLPIINCVVFVCLPLYFKY